MTPDIGFPPATQQIIVIGKSLVDWAGEINEKLKNGWRIIPCSIHTENGFVAVLERTVCEQ